MLFRLQFVEATGAVHPLMEMRLGEWLPYNDGEEHTVPPGFVLHPNYPNPFNPVTHVEFGLPHAAWVTLKIYDLLGREIKTLVNRRLEAGYHTVQWDGTDHVTGLFYQLQQPLRGAPQHRPIPPNSDGAL